MPSSDWTQDYTRDPNLGLSEKWRRYKEEKGRRGAKSGIYLNKWVPYYFFSVLFGAYAWYALAAVPAHHFRDPIWYTINEMFGLYVEIQLLVNWILIHKTDSSYQPAAEDSTSVLLEDHVYSYNTTLLREGTSPSRGAVSNGATTFLKPSMPSSSSLASPSETATAISTTVTDTTTGAVAIDQSFETLGTGSELIHVSTSATDNAVCRPRTQRTGLTYQMMVATEITASGEVQRRAFPYWAWVPCLWCRRLRPPRCHHCTLCGRCVLKRDHHCYFTRVCIGVNNQRHFLVFLFWSIVMTSLASCELIPYTAQRVFSTYSYWNVFFPVNLISVLSGQLPLLYFHLILMVWSLAFLFLVSLGMFSVHLFCTMRGLTKFEYDHGIRIVDTRPMFGRLRAVMGRNWGLAVLMPGYINGPPLDNGVKWPHVRP